jgi:hypothetical protein
MKAGGNSSSEDPILDATFQHRLSNTEEEKILESQKSHQTFPY